MSIYFKVIDTILPSELVQYIETSHHEECMVAVAMMVVKLIQETVLSIKKHQIKDLDANPGDRGCQLRAVILRNLVRTSAVITELKQLEEAAKALLALVIQRNSLNGKLKACHDKTGIFFEKHISSLKVSEEMIYILHCKLLTVTKVKNYVESNGIVVTKLDFCTLSKLSKNIYIIDKLEKNYREQIICDSSSWLSQASLSMIQKEGKKRPLSPILARMIMEVRQNRPEPPQTKKSFGLYKSKSFGCQFYEVQMVLTILREQEAVIAIKTVVAKGKPQMLFYQPQAPGEEFSPVDVTNFPKETLIVVFEGVVQPHLSLEAFSEEVTRIGFSPLMLACLSQEEPFEHGSTLSDVTDQEAYAEIEGYRKFAKEIGPPIAMDHIYCNSLQEELKSC